MGGKSSKLKPSASLASDKMSKVSVGSSTVRGNEAALVGLITYRDSFQKERVVLSPIAEAQTENVNPGSNVAHHRRAVMKGTFYSKTTAEMGVWMCDDGSLTLTWDSSNRSLEFLQTVLASEINWRCESANTDLQFLKVRGSKFLPAWIMPRDPEEMKQDLAKESADRDVRAQIEEGRARGAIAKTYSECALCFFELHLMPVGILRYQSKRSCPHYFHTSCAQGFKSRQEKGNKRLGCPICYKRFTEVKSLPDLLRDPRLWFQLCDTDLGGSLDKKEVVEGLLAVLAVDRERLEKSINDSWANWDLSGDGSIELAEFINPKSGLKIFLVKNYNIFRKTETSNRDIVPSLDAEPRKWFDYWDYNRSGTLERIEVARALIKTFCVTAWGEPLIHRANDMSELALSLWDILGYSSRAKLTFEEFMKPYGLADQVIHNFTHGEFFGVNE